MVELSAGRVTVMAEQQDDGEERKEGGGGEGWSLDAHFPLLVRTEGEP